jgi:hypothetical protein
MDTIELLDMMLVITTLALLIGFVLYQIHHIDWLKHHGRRIAALVTSIRHETGKTYAGFSHENYYVTATWADPRTGKTYTFWTWFIDTCPVIGTGNLIPILINPRHPEQYVMEG